MQVIPLDGRTSDDVAANDIVDGGIVRRRVLDLAAFNALRCAIRRLRPDIIHVWSRYAERFARPAALSAGSCRVVATVRHVRFGQSPLSSLIDRSLAQRTHTVANCPLLADACLKVGVPPARLTIIADGVAVADENAISAMTWNQARAEWLTAHGQHSDAKLLIFVGRLEPRQQLKNLLWATDQLKLVHDDAVTLIVGDGSQRATIERYARLYRIDHKIYFVGPRDDVPRLLPLAHVLVAPAAGAALSSAILEAMAVGVPVVANDIPAHRQLIQHEQTGILTPTVHRAALGGAIHRLLHNPAQAEQLATQARRMVAERFSVATMAEAYGQLYRRLLGS